MLTILAIIFVVAIIFGFSWGVTVGIIKLITLCFGLAFSLPIATGIWLILVLVSAFLKPSISNKTNNK